MNNTVPKITTHPVIVPVSNTPRSNPQIMKPSVQTMKPQTQPIKPSTQTMRPFTQSTNPHTQPINPHTQTTKLITPTVGTTTPKFDPKMIPMNRQPFNQTVSVRPNNSSPMRTNVPIPIITTNNLASPLTNNSTQVTEPATQPYKSYNFVHTTMVSVQGHENDYLKTERHVVLNDDGTRSEYLKNIRYTNGSASLIHESGDPSIVDKVSAIDDKFTIHQ